VWRHAFDRKGVEWQQKFAWMRGGECTCYEQRVEKYDFLSFVA
jgi:hypothetical protein